MGKIMGGEDSATHYMDGNSMLIKPSRDFRKTTLFTIKKKDNKKKSKGNTNLKEEEFNIYNDKIKDGKSSNKQNNKNKPVCSAIFKKFNKARKGRSIVMGWHTTQLI